MPRIGYVSSFFPLQYALMILTEYICADGHRIHVRTETIDWQARGVVWQ
jgi:hypothetical protein